MFKHEKPIFSLSGWTGPTPIMRLCFRSSWAVPRGAEERAAVPVPELCIKDPEIKDLFLDVAAEELCHLEMVAATVNMLNGHDPDAMHATVGNGKPTC